ncbi:hypothetical protein NDU88_003943 [Pleurodeles waltl]|uniref:Uncharacterized protein n=1 Tax=Pleurodeles waltl TaxID=8319 RepID=A0AAV7QEJ9_PLEWA|nr:hypothetical protein NDU88_003943 [Pleurodeles waltl]
MTSAGRRGGRREAADAPFGRCGGVDFAPLTPLLGRSNVRARQVYGRRVGFWLQAAWFVVVAVLVAPRGRLCGALTSQMRAWRKGNWGIVGVRTNGGSAGRGGGTLTLVVRAGRTFCRRLALALLGQALPHHHVRLKVGVRENLRMWATFLESFNGIPLKVWRDCEWDVQLFSDAAGSTWFGLYWEGRWCAEEWPNEWKNGGRGIAFLELFPLIVAVCLWGTELRHSRVLFRVDNMVVVQMVNRQSAREAGVLQL